MGGGGIIALDIAKTCGFATAEPNGEVISGIKKLHSASGDHGQIFLQFKNWLSDMIIVHRPKLLIWEAPLVMAVGGQNRAILALGLSAIADMVGTEKEVFRREVIANNTVKKFFTGNGHAKKDETIREAISRGFSPQDDNEADAQAVFCWAANNHKMPYKVKGKLYAPGQLA